MKIQTDGWSKRKKRNNMTLVLYIHGKGGNASESTHYKNLFSECDVMGLDYSGNTPWDVGKEINGIVGQMKKKYDRIILVANSIGAYFTMNADIGSCIDRAYFISPVVNMEKLICDTMIWANVTEDELREKRTIPVDFGDDLSWEYLCYVREHPVVWNVPTHILYGERDNLTTYETIRDFAEGHNASVTVMEGGEHWFHTGEQMKFLDDWIINLPV